MGKKTHMTDYERSLIASGIRDGMSFAEIARAIGKSQSTVSMEVIKHRHAEGAVGQPDLLICR